MSELIESVARALYETETGRSDWGEETEWMDGRQRAYWCDMARAAILAMREPTQEMLNEPVPLSGGGTECDYATEEDRRDHWQAMIDVALEEKGGS